MFRGFARIIQAVFSKLNLKSVKGRAVKSRNKSFNNLFCYEFEVAKFGELLYVYFSVQVSILGKDTKFREIDYL